MRRHAPHQIAGAHLPHVQAQRAQDVGELAQAVGRTRRQLRQRTHRFGGLLPGRSVMQQRLAALGTQFVDLPEGRLAGHTFHYSKSDTSLAPLVLAKTSDGRDGEAIYRHGRLTASYVHFYFPGNPAAVAALLG